MLLIRTLMLNSLGVHREERPMTSRQKEAGIATRAETRRRLVLAAAELFAERGYSGATVSAIAERAGVSLQTLYLAWGSKRRLLRAYLEYALTGSPTAVTDDAWVDQVRTMVSPDPAPHGQDPEVLLRSFARTFRLIAERAALGWQLYRDAAAVDADIAADHAELEVQRRRTLTGALSGLDERDLRSGLTRSAAIDTAMVIAGPASYDVLVRHRDYSLDDFETWVGDTLVAALLRDRHPQDSPRKESTENA